ncbi:hypothetical protein PDESU_01973 [Pontiella desulfatans]|uniref:Winged helix-turn helix domain-containing protein n=1 Tax=Pontiella desulfatans TaxID=2750659 RepID=A0A6C2U209_PONDE|nr:helix-turn-helix domain-containing protein [Pontiella desulfatans]VGO13416.1 hypothetical protein PDESU_01973 [Pontiella desulfatans]
MGSEERKKEEVLRESGTFNARASRISDGLFGSCEFFDARDVVQVKYEMLRRVHEDGVSVAQASADFGFSRVAFYDIQRAWTREGMNGLLPRPRGPRHGHKLTDEVLGFMRSALVKEPALRTPELAERVLGRFGLTVHPRSIERALAKGAKKGLLM